MIYGLIILAVAIVVAAFIYSKSLERYHVKPRISFATATVMGITETSEQLQFVTQLWADETPQAHRAKLQTLYELREERLKVQNQRLLDIQDASKKAREEALAAQKAEDEAPSEPAKVTALNQKR